MIYNISAIRDLMPGGNHYSYTRIKNLINGLRGDSTKKEIQQIRKIISDAYNKLDKHLEVLEKESKK